MKTEFATLAGVVLTCVAGGAAELPPTITLVPAQQLAFNQPVYVYEQRLYGATGTPVLIAPEQAQSIVDKFKDAYAKLGSPRLLIYVNRDLLGEHPGVRRPVGTEHVDRTITTIDSGNPAGPGQATTVEKVSGEYATSTGGVPPTLVDRQSTRDVERLFGRPLRISGAALTDHQTATAAASAHASNLKGEGESARRDREALANYADVVIEVLITNHSATFADNFGEHMVNVPDIQATAIQLKDAKVLGQASATDVLGKGPAAARLAASFDARDITEATALALMEDMLKNVK